MGKARSFLVPDLTPRDHRELKGVHFRYVFVAESPHVSEISPERISERRPLCGTAGKVWWSALSAILEGREIEELSLVNLLGFCCRHRIAVMNAVSVPLDGGIIKHFKQANPIRTLGFSKQAGPRNYKRPSRARDRAVLDLRKRLLDPALQEARIVALGNDADWFVRAALTQGERSAAGACKIAHPSAWWRRGGHFGRISREKLRQLLA